MTLVLTAALVLTSLSAVATAAPAGTVTLPGTNFGGVTATLRITNLNTSNDSTQFANNHIWIYDNCLCNWVEVGINIGHSAQKSVGNSPTFEWVDNRPGGGYNEHILGSIGDAAYNTYYSASIDWQGGGTWLVGVGGYYQDSTNNSFLGRNIFAGAETSDPGGARICTSASNLGYYDGNNNFVSGWHDASNGNAYVWPGNADPPYAYWVTQNSWERSYDNINC